MALFGCGMIGSAAAYAFVFIAQYYTDYKYPPVRVIAEASTTGHGTNIIAGVGVGMESTAAPVVVISAAIVASYWCGQTAGLVDAATGKPIGGLFGTAVATMGMLSTAAYVLTMDVFGPIADNAGGIVEMSEQPESVRDITDQLDSVGNTTKATTKGYAIGSAALARSSSSARTWTRWRPSREKPSDAVDIAVPEVFVGGLLGSMIVYLFTAFACTAVGRSAQEVVTEVRRQFAERPGIMTRECKPDYSRCVSIVARSALRGMIKPGLLAVLGPVAVGVAFRYVGAWTGQELLGARAVAGMLMFATVSGILMALFLNTAGGAWDNAKKYVETGAHGGKRRSAQGGGDGRHGGGSVQGYRGAEHTRAHQDARHHYARHGAHVPRLRLRRRGKEPALLPRKIKCASLAKLLRVAQAIIPKHVFEDSFSEHRDSWPTLPSRATFALTHPPPSKSVRILLVFRRRSDPARTRSRATNAVYDASRNSSGVPPCASDDESSDDATFPLGAADRCPFPRFSLAVTQKLFPRAFRHVLPALDLRSPGHHPGDPAVGQV